MTFKTILPIICLAICLFSMASVCASDANDTAIAIENSLEMDHTTDDLIGVDKDAEMAFPDQNDVLTADELSFARLNTTINGNTDNEIYLNSDYKYSGEDSDFKEGIEIRRDVTIYGNGHTINGNSDARIFKITKANVVFYNIIFTKGNATGDYGGAICGSCKAINCTFTGNAARMGGAIMGGLAINCTFTGNTARYGGAIAHGTAYDCNFTYNNANSEGGALYESLAINCTFTGNTARFGGAMAYGGARDCNFTYNNANSGGGALFTGSAVKCHFANNYAYGGYGGAISDGAALNCTFKDNEEEDEWPNDMYLCYCTNSPGNNEQCKPLNAYIRNSNVSLIYGSDNKVSLLLNALPKEKNLPLNLVDGEIIIYRNGNVFKSYSCLSNIDVDIDLPAGTYVGEMIVTFPGFTVESKNITIKIDKVTPSIKVSSSAISYPKDVVVNVKTDINGTYIVKVGERYQIVDLIPNKAENITFTSLPANEVGYIVNVTYIGPDNENYSATEADVRAIVHKAIANIEVSAGDATYPDVVIRVKSDVSGIYAVKVGDKSETVTLVAGEAKSVTFTGLAANDAGYVVNVTHESENYTGFNDTIKVVVHKAIANIEVSAGDVAYPDDVVVSVQSDVSGTYVVKVGDKSETVTLVAGEIKNVNFSGLASNEVDYIVNVTYDATQNYTDAFNDTETVKVKKGTVRITAEAIATIYNINKDLIVVLNDCRGNPIGGVNVTVDLNGAKNYTTESNGQVNISTRGLAANTYNVSITFNGTENYLNSSRTTTVTILKKAVKISAKPLTTTYNVHKYLVIALKDNNGNPIRNVDATFTINGVTYKCRSDNKGDARLIIRLAPKTYTAKITFDNANYSHLIQYVKVTVLKAAPKLTAKKKTFKATKKVKKYTVTLKDNNGKAIKKVKLTIKIGKKTYKAKTNSKGKAVFKIKNLTKKGKYSAKITYKGNYLYKKATKKVKIVIK